MLAQFTELAMTTDTLCHEHSDSEHDAEVPPLVVSIPPDYDEFERDFDHFDGDYLGPGNEDSQGTFCVQLRPARPKLRPPSADSAFVASDETAPKDTSDSSNETVFSTLPEGSDQDRPSSKSSSDGHSSGMGSSASDNTDGELEIPEAESKTPEPDDGLSNSVSSYSSAGSMVSDNDEDSNLSLADTEQDVRGLKRRFSISASSDDSEPPISRMRLNPAMSSDSETEPTETDSDNIVLSESLELIESAAQCSDEAELSEQQLRTLSPELEPAGASGDLAAILTLLFIKKAEKQRLELEDATSIVHNGSCSLETLSEDIKIDVEETKERIRCSTSLNAALLTSVLRLAQDKAALNTETLVKLFSRQLRHGLEVAGSAVVEAEPEETRQQLATRHLLALIRKPVAKVEDQRVVFINDAYEALQMQYALYLDFKNGTTRVVEADIQRHLLVALDEFLPKSTPSAVLIRVIFASKTAARFLLETSKFYKSDKKGLLHAIKLVVELTVSLLAEAPQTAIKLFDGFHFTSLDVDLMEADDKACKGIRKMSSKQRDFILRRWNSVFITVMQKADFRQQIILQGFAKLFTLDSFDKRDSDPCSDVFQCQTRTLAEESLLDVVSVSMQGTWVESMFTRLLPSCFNADSTDCHLGTLIDCCQLMLHCQNPFMDDICLEAVRKVAPSLAKNDSIGMLKLVNSLVNIAITGPSSKLERAESLPAVFLGLPPKVSLKSPFDTSIQIDKLNELFANGIFDTCVPLYEPCHITYDPDEESSFEDHAAFADNMATACVQIISTFLDAQELHDVIRFSIAHPYLAELAVEDSISIGSNANTFAYVSERLSGSYKPENKYWEAVKHRRNCIMLDALGLIIPNTPKLRSDDIVISRYVQAMLRIQQMPPLPGLFIPDNVACFILAAMVVIDFGRRPQTTEALDRLFAVCVLSPDHHFMFESTVSGFSLIQAKISQLLQRTCDTCCFELSARDSAAPFAFPFIIPYQSTATTGVGRLKMLVLETYCAFEPGKLFVASSVLGGRSETVKAQLADLRARVTGAITAGHSLPQTEAIAEYIRQSLLEESHADLANVLMTYTQLFGTTIPTALLILNHVLHTLNHSADALRQLRTAELFLKEPQLLRYIGFEECESTAVAVEIIASHATDSVSRTVFALSALKSQKSAL